MMTNSTVTDEMLAAAGDEATKQGIAWNTYGQLEAIIQAALSRPHSPDEAMIERIAEAAYNEGSSLMGATSGGRIQSKRWHQISESDRELNREKWRTALAMESARTKGEG